MFGSYVIVYYNIKDPTRYYVKDFKSPPLIIGDITFNSKGGVRTLEDVLRLQQRGIRTEAFVADVQPQTKNGKTYYYLNAFGKIQVRIR